MIIKWFLSIFILYKGVRYDTGAQYYSLKPIMNDMHNRWSNAGMVSSWFSDTKGKT